MRYNPRMQIRLYRQQDQEQVLNIWKRCGLVVPWNDPVEDIRRKTEDSPKLFLVGILHDKVAGTVMAGFEGHRGWINYLAVDPSNQGSGYGRLLMTAAEEALKKTCCPKINLQVRRSNTAVIRFYEAIGYKIDNVVGMGKRLVDDR